jgi:preprotein translocase subunit SecD
LIFIKSLAGGSVTMAARLLKIICFLIAIIFFSIGCQPKPTWENYQGGIHVVLQVESKGDPAVDVNNTAQIAEIIAERIKQFRIKNRIIKVQGERHIVIQLPPCKNPDRVVDLISKPCMLEFKLVDEEHSLEEALKGNIPSGARILYQKEFDPKTGKQIKIPYLIVNKTLMTGETLQDARVRLDQHNRPYIAFSLKPEGARLFEQITGNNVGKRLAIIIDGSVYSAPIVRQRISGGEAIIEGRFTVEDARNLAIVLRAGGYPARTEVIEYRPLNKEIWLGND